jgi:hypothetical protein
MICGRCDRAIRKGEPYTEHEITRPTGPGALVYRHVELCRKVPTRSTQASIRH